MGRTFILNKREIIRFFNERAADWDAGMVRSDAKINAILDAADVGKNKAILDVACGTGVLFQDYLNRGVARVTGVDIAPEMARIAATKLRDPRVEVLCGDVETICLPRKYDCVVVYNAFPHFPEPARLLKRLAGCLKPGGRVTVAHGMSLRALAAHHSGAAQPVSRTMLTPEEMRPLMEAAGLTVDVMISDEEKYIVSGYAE